MNLDIEDSQLVVRERTKYYSYRWAIFIGSISYILVSVVVSAFITWTLLPILLILVPVSGAALYAYGLIFYLLGCTIKDWLTEEKK